MVIHELRWPKLYPPQDTNLLCLANRVLLGGSLSPSPHLPEDVLSSFLSLVVTGSAVMELPLFCLVISMTGALVVERSSSSCA